MMALKAQFYQSQPQTLSSLGHVPSIPTKWGKVSGDLTHCCWAQSPSCLLTAGSGAESQEVGSSWRPARILRSHATSDKLLSSARLCPLVEYGCEVALPSWGFHETKTTVTKQVTIMWLTEATMVLIKQSSQWLWRKCEINRLSKIVRYHSHI